MKKVSVTIDGVEYQIVGDRNEADIIKVAKYIDEKIKETRRMAPNLNRVNSTVLTSVNIVDSLFESDKKVKELEAEVKKLRDGYHSTTENVEKEFDSVLEKLEEAELNASNLEEEVKNLKKLLEEKELENKALKESSSKDKVSSSSKEVELEKEKLVKTYELKLKEMEKKVAVAESMATEFQNKAYNLQLNLEEIKNKEGNK